MVSRNFPPDVLGGGEIVAERLSSGLSTSIEVRLATMWRYSPHGFPAYVRATRQRSTARFRSYLTLYRHAARCYRDFKPDLLHAMTLEVPIPKGPSVLTIHHLGHIVGTSPRSASRVVGRAQRLLIRNRLDRFGALVVPSRATLGDLREYFGVSPDRVQVIPWGVDLWNRMGKPPDKKAPGAPYEILLPSRLSPEKGQMAAVRALAIANRELGGGLRMTIAGFPSNRDFVDRVQRASQGLPIEFVKAPNGDVLASLYSHADVVLFPTLISEGFGLVAGEALSMGKSLIASDLPAIREIAQDDALFVEPGDAEGLARALMKAFENRREFSTRAQGAAERVRRDYSWPLAISRYLAAYRNVLGGT